jgi:hypothetical protein
VREPPSRAELNGAPSLPLLYRPVVKAIKRGGRAFRGAFAGLHPNTSHGSTPQTVVRIGHSLSFSANRRARAARAVGARRVRSDPRGSPILSHSRPSALPRTRVHRLPPPRRPGGGVGWTACCSPCVTRRTRSSSAASRDWHARRAPARPNAVAFVLRSADVRCWARTEAGRPGAVTGWGIRIRHMTLRDSPSATGRTCCRPCRRGSPRTRSRSAGPSGHCRCRSRRS